MNLFVHLVSQIKQTLVYSLLYATFATSVLSTRQLFAVVTGFTALDKLEILSQIRRSRIKTDDLRVYTPHTECRVTGLAVLGCDVF